ncbi:MAG: CDC27 family protein, partial [Pirellula sp.]
MSATEDHKDPAKDKNPGHSFHAEAFNEGPRQAAYLMQGMGNVHWKISTESPMAQRFFDQGISQLHGFWYFEAERSFRQAASIEPDRAIFYWGMARANTENPERSAGFIEQAMKRIDKSSPLERRLIEAWSRRVKDWPKPPEEKKEGDKDTAKSESKGKKKPNVTDEVRDKRKERFKAYARELDEIVQDYPEEIELKAMLVLQLWQNQSQGHDIQSYTALDSLLEDIFRRNPRHPAHHFRIHLWDYRKEKLAIKAAAECGPSAPGIAHMWHMPGHTYSRLNRFVDAVWQQEASARTDHARMMRDRLLPDQIHNFAHNNEWLIRNQIFLGQLGAAQKLALNMLELPRHPKYNLVSKEGCSTSYGRQRLMQVLQAGELWEETLRLAATPYLEETDVPREQVAWHRMVGRAAYRLGREAEGDQQHSTLAERLCEKQAERNTAILNAEKEARAAGKNPEEITKAGTEAGDRLRGDIEPIERAIQELETLRLAADDRWADAVRITESGHDLDAFWLARLYLHAGQPDKAIEKLQERVNAEPQSTLPLAHLAHTQWRLGRLHEARATLEKLQAISSHLDLDAPPFARLAPLAAQCGWDRDWRGTWQ